MGSCVVSSLFTRAAHYRAFRLSRKLLGGQSPLSCNAPEQTTERDDLTAAPLPAAVDRRGRPRPASRACDANRQKFAYVCFEREGGLARPGPSSPVPWFEKLAMLTATEHTTRTFRKMKPMGFFTKTIPERKWVEVSAALHNGMKRYRAKWFNDFVQNVSPLGIGLSSRELTKEIEGKIGMLQFVVAATAVREGGYVTLKDFDFFIDLISISITSKKMEELGSKSVCELAASSDPKIAVHKWALMMLPIVAGTEHNQKLAEVLSQWAMLLVIQSKIQTCEACGDRKGAEKVRKLFGS
jgi:hypothetical protein